MGERPSVRQVYALAAVLCEREGEAFPGTFAAASDLIERLRLETGHPEPRLSDVLLARRRRRRRRRGGRRGRRSEDERRASDVAAELAREMR